ncbi:MAG: hypothetical protein KDB00_01060 [Planctomycetales bacterium]|nr:hypothetical protein [Planctomycetales bacterium]
MNVIPQPNEPDVVWVVDGNHPWHDALTWMDQFRGNTVAVTDVKGLVSACASKSITKTRQIRFLSIFGHGMGGYQSVGAGKKFEVTGTKSLHFSIAGGHGRSELSGPAEQSLRRLNGLLRKDATILLAGCNVGEGEKGSGLLTSVSKILNGRPVQAYTSQVYWWTGYMFGTLKEARSEKIASKPMTYSINPYF